MSNLEQLVNETVGLITVTGESLNQARERAGRFLVVSAVLTTELRNLETQMVKTETAQDGSEAQAVLEGTGKNVTENKLHAKVNPLAIETKEQHKELEAKRNWLKLYIKIFENAHLMYRQLSKES